MLISFFFFLLLVFPSNPQQDEGLVFIAVREAWAWPQALTVEMEERKSDSKKKVSSGWECDMQAVQLLVQVPEKSLSS